MTEALIQVVTTLETQADAKALGSKLVAQQLAACAQVSGPIDSIYPWKGEICQDTEWRLTLKSRQSLYKKLERLLSELHPYEEPQIIALPLVEVAEGYRKWLIENT